MSQQTEIASLVARLGFTVDDSQLTAFNTRLQGVTTLLKTFRQVAANKVIFKVGIDKEALAGVKSQLMNLKTVKVKLDNVAFSVAALKGLRNQLDTQVFQKTYKVQSVTVSASALRPIKESIKAYFATTKIEVPITANTKPMTDAVRAWQAKVKRFKLLIRVGISQRQFEADLRAAMARAQARMGTITIRTPDIRVSVDRAHLRREIAAALAQIRREVRIRVDLRGGAGGAGGRGGYGGAGGFGGGAVGAAAGTWGRGFIPGLSGAFAVKSVSDISQELQASTFAMEAVSDSTEQAAENMKFLRDLAKETGKTVRSLAPSFTGIKASTKGTGLEGKENDIFGSFTRYGTMMGLDDESMKGSFRAITQMVSKQQVMAEELRGQLAERLPAAVRIAADVMTGGDTVKLNEMMKAGKLDPNVLLPKMAEHMDKLRNRTEAYNNALNSSRVKQGRFNVAFEEFIRLFAEAGFDKTMGEFWDQMAKGTEDAQKNVKGLADAFWYLMRPVMAVLKIFQNLNDYINRFSEYIGVSATKLKLFGGIVAAMLFPLTRWLTILSMAALVIEDLMVWEKGGQSFFKRMFEGLTPETQAMLQETVTNVKALVEKLVELGGIGWERLKEFFNYLDGDGNNVLKTVLGTINSVIDRLTMLLDLVGKLMNGDISGAVDTAGAIVAKQMATIAGVAFGGQEAIRPSDYGVTKGVMAMPEGQKVMTPEIQARLQQELAAQKASRAQAKEEWIRVNAPVHITVQGGAVVDHNAIRESANLGLQEAIDAAMATKVKDQ